MDELPECDCLNWCGDDPWLKQEKCKPCADKINHDNRPRVKDVLFFYDPGEGDCTVVVQLTRKPTADEFEIVCSQLRSAL
ncbi:hypothetical protein [Deefgea piscis]|uniref:hypothetical protein n=1 Tax=Deefgea piscis TaxID=2739061 RepID=UPI001C819E0C|nr:hypothetical protein [Deefgea piscis]QZA80881.1 hypothetical protein K4H25_15525 [Deefgea piscis]